ncbi:MAG: DUF1540 domain-containing protein [Clostridiales bacterium]|nr:DUF1540 domain-containing protein [Clostridiales bacterium]
MTVLDCTVTGCIYNEDKQCCKGDIIVEGSSAERTEETCCGSFKERGSSAVTNAAGGAKREIEVACEACKCVFNKERKCSADHIGIAGANACTCGETECQSFCCK